MSRHYEYTFAAGQSIQINVGRASYVRCMEGAIVFLVSADGREDIEIQAGLGLAFEDDFSKLRVTSASAQVIKLYIGDRRVDDNRAYGEINATIAGYNSSTISADVTSSAEQTDTIAANLTRAKIKIQADVDNASDIRVGPEGDATATKGWRLTPGSSYTFELTEAIDVYLSAASLTYRYWEY